MSGKYPIISGKKMRKFCKKLGYTVVSIRGSHVKMKHLQGSVIIFPLHKELKIGTLKDVISNINNDLGISEEELIKMLEKIQ